MLSEDFEVPDTGNYFTYFSGDTITTATNKWAVTAQSVDLYEAPARAEAAAFDGTQAIDLTGSPGEGVIEAVFNTVPGGEYELTFHYARNDLLGADIGTARVEVVGFSVLLEDSVKHDPASHNFDEYLLFQDTFTADHTEGTLRFTGRNPGIAGITLDGVTVTAIDVVGVSDLRVPGVGDGTLRASPNPFTAAVTVEFVNAVPGFVEMKIYDIRGRSVATLVQEEMNAGSHAVHWAGLGFDGRQVRSGVYLCVMTTAHGRSSQQLLLLK